MGAFGLGLVFYFWVWFCGYSFGFVNGKSDVGSVFVNGKSSIGRIDSDYICATMDWWPPEKCDYGTCAWDHASMLNVDLNNTIFFNAIKAFSPLKIRLGGTLQDKVIYETEDHQKPCVPFSLNTSALFSFNEGCLPLSRWDELNTFFSKAGAEVIFGLNALNGRTIKSDSTAVGNWDYKNAESLMRYTVKKGYKIYGWELGNELCGSGVGVRVAADQYATDTVSLKKIADDVYSDIETKPLIVGPGGFFDANWFKEYISKSNNSLDIATHHIYNLGPGRDEHLIEKILNPTYLDGEASTFSSLQSTIENSKTQVSAWVGEAGGAYNSGRNLVTNAFVFSFWYLDQLAMSASYDTKTYCRQSLIGGNYGLLNTTTFVPNPDYYSALLWHHLMGRNVLSTKFSGTKNIRAYAHCAKQSKGITLLLINLDNSTTIETKVSFNSTYSSNHQHKSHHHHHHNTELIRLPHQSGKNRERKKEETTRVEYHLTPLDGDLHSQVMLLNGKILAVDSEGQIPPLEGKIVNSSEPISVAPFSIVFVHISSVSLPACR